MLEPCNKQNQHSLRCDPPVLMLADLATPGTIDFGNIFDAIVVHSGAGLSFQNMILEGIPEGANSSKAGDNVIPDLALWPSVGAEPGAMVRCRLRPRQLLQPNQSVMFAARMR